ncbi:MAG: TolC family protein [Archangium sp.]|nr:TolC family protein [Archangium sp.]
MLGLVALAPLSARADDAGVPTAPLADPLLEPPAPAGHQLASWEEALQTWRSHSTDLRVASAEVLRAQGRRRTALGALLPSLTANGLASFSLLPAPAGNDATTSALFGAAPYQTGSLIAQLAVIDARSWNALALAADAERATELSLADARRVLILNLAQSLLAVVTSERIAELNRVGLKDALDRLHLAERSNRAGANTEIDLGRLRQDAELARSQVVTGDESLHQAREALSLAVGLDGPVGVKPEFQLNGLADQLNGTCHLLDALEKRPDQLAAQARVDIADRGVLDVKAQFLPSLALRSTAQVFTFPGAGVFPIWNLQAVLTVPLWDGGARYGALKDAHAQKSQAEARVAGTQRQGRVEVERAKRGIDVAEKSRAIAAAAHEQSAKTDTLTRRAFDAGLGTSLELVTAASSLRQQQLNLALREYDVIRARVVALFALADCPL